MSAPDLTVDECMEEVEYLSKMDLHHVEAAARRGPEPFTDLPLLPAVQQVMRQMVNGDSDGARSSLVALMEGYRSGSSEHANVVGGSFVWFLHRSRKIIWSVARNRVDSSSSP